MFPWLSSLQLCTGGSLLHGFSNHHSTGAFRSTKDQAAPVGWDVEGCTSSTGIFLRFHPSCGGPAARVHVSVAHYVDLIKLITAEHAQRERGRQHPETDNLVRRRLHAEILLSTSAPAFLSQLFTRCSLTSPERQRAVSYSC